MRSAMLVFTLTCLAFPGFAQAAVFVTGSVNQASSNLGLQSSVTRGGSASVDLGLGRYVRVGVTHQQSFKESEGHSENKDIAEDDPDRYVEFSSKEHILANSVDFTFILYEGELIVPYLKAGAIWKSYFVERVEDGVADDPIEVRNAGPFPNLGAGVGLKLNRQFTLKLFHKASPGFVYDPAEDKTVSVWDRETTIGLSYQL